MKFADACSSCHVRSSIYRTGDPSKIFTADDLDRLPLCLRDLHRDKVGRRVPKRYPKNHQVPFIERVPAADQEQDDWEEYDPREDDDGSLFMFND